MFISKILSKLPVILTSFNHYIVACFYVAACSYMLMAGSLEGEMGIRRTGWQEKTHGDRHDFLLKSQPLMHLSKDKKAGQAPPLKAGNWFCLFCRRLAVRLLAAIL